MAENVFDAGGYLISFPVFAVGIFDPAIAALLQAFHPDGDNALLLFTDEDQANAFCGDHSAPDGFRPRAFTDPFALLGLLAAAERKEMTHVAFDPSKGTKATSFSIPTLREHALSWLT